MLRAVSAEAGGCSRPRRYGGSPAHVGAAAAAPAAPSLTRCGEPAALAAFHQVCAPGGPGTAELFDRAVSALKSDGSRYCRGDGLRRLWAADGRESFRRANLLYSLLYSLLYIPLYRKLLYKAENCCIRRYTSDTHCVKALHSYTATIQLYSAIQRYTLYSYTALHTIQPVQHPLVLRGLSPRARR